MSDADAFSYVAGSAREVATPRNGFGSVTGTQHNGGQGHRGCRGLVARCLQPTESALSATKTVTAPSEMEPAQGAAPALLIKLLRSFFFIGVVYLWGFESYKLVKLLPKSIGKFGFGLLAAVPLLLARNGRTAEGIVSPLKGLADLTREKARKHFFLTLMDPLRIILDSVFIFLSINLFAKAIGSNFRFRTPPLLTMLDPDGDGVITAAEIESVVLGLTGKILSATVASAVGWFLLRLKKPPQMSRARLDAARRSKSLLERFWAGVVDRRGLYVILDVAFTVAALSLPTLRWLRVIGLNPQTVLTFGGIGGLAFGLAAQNVVGNIISGFLILVTNPFRIGDFIEIGHVSGRVKAIRWGSTEVETSDGPIVLLPNSKVVNSETHNRTISDKWYVEFKLPVKFARDPASPGHFSRVSGVLEGLSDMIKKLDVCSGLLLRDPAVHFQGMKQFGSLCHPAILIELLLDNQTGREELCALVVAELESEVNVAAIQFLQSQGCEVPGLHL